MNWFWLKWRGRHNAPTIVHNVTMTEPAKVLAPADAEVRASEDERRMQIIRDCIEYGRRHYEALPYEFDRADSCLKCMRDETRLEFVTLPDAHSDACGWGWNDGSRGGYPGHERLHDAVSREYLRVLCAACGFEHGLALPADAEVDQ